MIGNKQVVIISFSGGKDSVASYIRAIQRYPEMRIELIFTDTGDEMPETYEYLRWFHEHVHPVIRLAQKLVGRREKGNRITELVNLAWDIDVKDFPEMGIITIFDEIRERFKKSPATPPWPSKGLRFCTRALKINPFYRYIRNNYPKSERDSIIIVKGLRAQESKDRKGKQTEYEEFEGGDYYDIWLAVYDMDIEEVFDLHRYYRIRINDVYDIRSRSNCVGCPFASSLDLKNTVKVYPEALNEYIAIEDETGYTWQHNKSLRTMLDTNEPALEAGESCTSGFCDI